MAQEDTTSQKIDVLWLYGVLIPSFSVTRLGAVTLETFVAICLEKKSVCSQQNVQKEITSGQNRLGHNTV